MFLLREYLAGKPRFHFGGPPVISFKPTRTLSSYLTLRELRKSPNGSGRAAPLPVLPLSRMHRSCIGLEMLLGARAPSSAGARVPHACLAASPSASVLMQLLDGGLSVCLSVCPALLSMQASSGGEGVCNTDLHI